MYERVKWWQMESESGKMQENERVKALRLRALGKDFHPLCFKCQVGDGESE